MAYTDEMPDFLRDLADAAASSKQRNYSNDDLKVISTKSSKNWGKVIIVPIDGEGKGEGAIKQLNQVSRVEKWVEGTKKDGTPYGFARRLFFFNDPKYYGSLTEAQERQLDRIKSKFNQVPEDKRGGIGRHQFTLIQGFVLKYTDKSTPVKTIYEKIPALLIYESKNFEKAFRNKITDMSETLGGYGWLSEMTSRDQHRKRYFSIELYLNKDEGAGFQVSVNCGKFDEDAIKLTGGKIGLDLSEMGEGIIDKFKDPIKTWLGIPQDGSRWNQDYMDDIEAVLNALIKGEYATETRTQSQPSAQPQVPNSNENFVSDPVIPTEVKTEETPKVDDSDDLPF